MTFEEMLDQAIAMLQRRGRLTYSTLKRQFQLDDAALDDLKEQLLYAYPQVVDDAGRGLVWTGELRRDHGHNGPNTPRIAYYQGTIACSSRVRQAFHRRGKAIRQHRGHWHQSVSKASTLSAHHEQRTMYHAARRTSALEEPLVWI